eukprot:g3546.t1
MPHRESQPKPGPNKPRPKATPHTTEAKTKPALKAKIAAPLMPTAEELDSLSVACGRLWELDDNRLTPGKEYRINVQAGKHAGSRHDAAKEPLFTHVDDCVVDDGHNSAKHKTYRAFVALLDNYERETGVAEQVTAEERAEEAAFLSAVLRTRPMRYLQAYLSAKNLLTPAERVEGSAAFRARLHKIWFQLYSRDTRGDSCGFEHVFVGEVRNGEVTGFHNWLQFYLEERKGAVDYKGYIQPRRRRGRAGGPERRHAPDGSGVYTKDEFVEYYGGTSEWNKAKRASRGRGAAPEGDRGLPGNNAHLLTLQFSWEQETKQMSSSFIGVSPEFELALYTLCFLAGEQENDVEVGGYRVRVTCYKIARDKIGTSFPKALD